MNKRICAFLLALVLFVSQFPAELAAESRELIEEMGNSWTFDAYYSGEDDKYDVEKDDDFNLKYQLEFHTNKDQPAGTVKMRIQKKLFLYRAGVPDSNGQAVVPSDIAVPKASKDANGNLITQSSKISPFNYYEETGEDGETYLVFFNYKTIYAGTNTSLQVLYRSIDTSKVVTETTWKLNPEIMVLDDPDGEGEYVPYTPLTGIVHTTSTFNKMTKDTLTIQGKKYAPGLYTEKQVTSYVKNWNLGSGWNSEFKDEDGDNFFNDYIYIIWKVSNDVTIQQPVAFTFEDIPTAINQVTGEEVTGQVVGVDFYNKSFSDDVIAIDGNTIKLSYYTKDNNKEDNIYDDGINELRIVTAYKKSDIGYDDNLDANEIDLTNTCKATLELYDTKEIQEKEDSVSWKYREYEWTPTEGYGLNLYKSTTTEYPGWLNIFDEASKGSEDAEEILDGIPFTIMATNGGYYYTHSASGTELENSYYTTTIRDGIMKDEEGFYLWAYNSSEDMEGPDAYADRVKLTKDDYYLTDVTVTRKDAEHDIYEDEDIAPVYGACGIDKNQDIDVYASFDGETYEKVYTLPWNKDTNGKKQTVPNEVLVKTIAGKEVRAISIKVEYNSVNYSTRCNIDMNVQIIPGSPTIQALMDEQEGSLREVNKSVTLRNMAQADSVGHYYENGIEMTTDVKSISRDKYYIDDHQLETAKGILSNISQKAASYKTSSVTNDTENGRVLMDYTLTAWNAYNIYSTQALNYLKGKESSGVLFEDINDNQWIFYDLLPYGMTLDPSAKITVGRITDLSNNDYVKYTSSWDTKDMKLTKTENIKNWKGTGRTMVIFHIKYTGSDPTVYIEKNSNNKENKLWLHGFGIQFRGKFNWEDIDLVKRESNIAAFSPEDPDVGLVGPTNVVYADDGKDENGNPLGTTQKTKSYKEFSNTVRSDGNVSVDANGDPIKNIMYASAVFDTDVAVASRSSIEKTVKAADNVYSDYDKTTAIEAGDKYRYRISISSGTTETAGIVAFDRLEYAVVDRKANDTMSFTRTDSEGNKVELTSLSDIWQGTFLGVDISSLEKIGISPIVYYSDKNDAEEPEKENREIEDVLSGEDWMTEEEWIAAGKSLSEVKAVAIDMRKKSDGSDFVLEPLKSLSFYIDMASPSEFVEEIPYTFNNPSFWAYPLNSQEARALTVGNSARVELAKAQDVEIEKRLKGQTPDQLKDQDFNFSIHYPFVEEIDLNGNEKYQPFAYQSYELWEKDADGNWSKDDNLHATDVDGRFSLKANQKAVFPKVKNADGLIIEEDASPYWNMTCEDNRADRSEDEPIHLVFTNEYRPLIYIEKKTSSVPADKSDEVANQQFAFKIKATYKNEQGTTVVQNFPKGTVFWIVSRAATNGTNPVKIREGKFADDNILYLKAGEVAAVFLENLNVSYTITEILDPLDKNTCANDWFCDTTEQSGSASIYGESYTFTNTYKWKDVYLNKKITNQSEEEVDAVKDTLLFRFGVYEVVDVNGTDVYIPVVTKNKWELVGSDITGTIASDGTFTCPAANGTIRIEGLAGDRNYEIKEIPFTDDELTKMVREGTITEEEKELYSLYQPVDGGAVDFTLPKYGTGKKVEIINDYKKRDLSISKQVILNENPTDEELAESQSREFTMTVSINGVPLEEGVPYVKTKNGQPVDCQTGPGGTIKLKNGEMAVFPDIALEGDTYTVVETEDDMFEQIYPAEGEPLKGTFASTDRSVRFINGTGENLVLSKEYTGSASELVSSISENADVAKDFFVNVSFSLKTKDGSVIQPSTEGSYEITKINQKDASDNEKITFSSDNRSLDIIPGYLYIFPEKITGTVGGVTGEYEIYSYKITESDSDIVKEYDGKWVHSSLSNKGDLSGNIETAPSVNIVNDLSYLDPEGSLIEKRMITDESTHKPYTVPEGAELVFLVERYEDGKWSPAADIEYVLADRTVYDQNGYTVTDDYEMIKGAFQKTDETGRISVKKSSGIYDYPVIWFIHDIVAVNKTGTALDGTLRITEVSSLSDKNWGLIAGYGDSNDLDYRLDKEDGTVFYNDPTQTGFEVEKYMAEKSDDTFTFSLEQVISASSYPIVSEVQIEETAIKTGIKYTVYDSETNQEKRTALLNSDGTFQLKAGEYAQFSLPDASCWIVKEKSGTTTTLEDLVTTDEEQMAKLSDNCMLFGQRTPEGEIVTITYNANGGRFENGAKKKYVSYFKDKDDNLTLLGENPIEQGEIPVLEDGTFIEWVYEEAPFNISEYTGENIEVTAKWYIPEPDLSPKTFEYTGSVQEWTAPVSGYYKLEAWGAEGASSAADSAGKGAYTSGTIYFEKGETVYVYVGNTPVASENMILKEGYVSPEYCDGGWNGGGFTKYYGNQNGYGGGGATDFRLVPSTENEDGWSDFDSLKSRIMVAAGGGGCVYNSAWKKQPYGGNGGALIGGDGTDGATWTGYASFGATQTSGGVSTNGQKGQDATYINAGSFGKGGSGIWTNYGCNGGGGGYYGGGASSRCHGGGSGGSSFISGYIGCDAIAKESTSDNIIHTGQADHYSGKVFTESNMEEGVQAGNGYAVISFVSN